MQLRGCDVLSFWMRPVRGVDLPPRAEVASYLGSWRWAIPKGLKNELSRMVELDLVDSLECERVNLYAGTRIMRPKYLATIETCCEQRLATFMLLLVREIFCKVKHERKNLLTYDPYKRIN